MTLSVRDAARDAPEVPALIDPQGSLTWRELARLVEVRAAELSTDGAIAFEAAPTRSAVVELLAILERGAIAVPLHPRWGAHEREQVRRHLDGFAASGIAALVRTSGTSGRAKLAALSESAFRAAAEASARRLGWVDGDRWLLSLPFAHVGGLSVIVRCLLARRTIVLAPEAIEALSTASCTIASLVPTQLARIVQRNMKTPAGLRILLLGGAACRPELARRARELGWPLRLTYGLTETCAQFATQREGDPDDVVGPPLEGNDARIEGGVLEVRSPALLAGFVENGSLIRATGPDGWYRTGDLAEIVDGNLRILGRADDVIVTGGEKVLPGEVEAALGEALATEVCVLGLPDPEWGSVVAAAVLHRNMGEVRRALHVVGTRLARHAVPKLIALVDELPTGAGGKLDRRAMASWPRGKWRTPR